MTAQAMNNVISLLAHYFIFVSWAALSFSFVGSARPVVDARSAHSLESAHSLLPVH